MCKMCVACLVGAWQDQHVLGDHEATAGREQGGDEEQGQGDGGCGGETPGGDQGLQAEGMSPLPLPLPSLQ